jgi:hypothetical protein
VFKEVAQCNGEAKTEKPDFQDLNPSTTIDFGQISSLLYLYFLNSKMMITIEVSPS